MTQPIDSRYYEKRIAQERALAERASDPIVRRVHTELADRYLRLLEPVAAAA